MDKRGVRFVIPHNIFKAMVEKILVPIMNVAVYNWIIDDLDVFTKNMSEEWKNKDPYIIENGLKFKKRIGSANYSVIEGRFIAFPTKAKWCDINTWEEFLKSDAKLMLWIIDQWECYFFSKEPELIELIYNNATNSCYNHISYLYENDFMGF
jgi:hypothetical protein